MPLTEKGEKIMSAMKSKYGEKEGERIFYSSKNKGTITGVDGDDYTELEKGKSRETVNKNVNKLIGAGHNREAAVGIAERKARGDDNQHMGFSKGQAEDVQKLTSAIDALTTRMDAFEGRRAMRRPVDVKPRTKDNMQPSMPHPKQVV